MMRREFLRRALTATAVAITAPEALAQLRESPLEVQRFLPRFTMSQEHLADCVLPESRMVVWRGLVLNSRAAREAERFWQEEFGRQSRALWGRVDRDRIDSL